MQVLQALLFVVLTSWAGDPGWDDHPWQKDGNPNQSENWQSDKDDDWDDDHPNQKDEWEENDHFQWDDDTPSQKDEWEEKDHFQWDDDTPSQKDEWEEKDHFQWDEDTPSQKDEWEEKDHFQWDDDTPSQKDDSWDDFEDKHPWQSDRGHPRQKEDWDDFGDNKRDHFQYGNDGCYVDFFSDEDFDGERVRIYGRAAVENFNSRALRSLRTRTDSSTRNWRGKVDSIRLSSSARLIVYRKKDFRGERDRLSRSVRDTDDLDSGENFRSFKLLCR